MSKITHIKSLFRSTYGRQNEHAPQWFIWYNFRTKQYEYIPMPSDFRDYIPQVPAAQNMYSLLVEHFGKSPLEAAGQVLSAITGYQTSAPNSQSKEIDNG